MSSRELPILSLAATPTGTSQVITAASHCKQLPSNISLFFLPLDEANASIAVIVIVSGSNAWEVVDGVNGNENELAK